MLHSLPPAIYDYNYLYCLNLLYKPKEIERNVSCFFFKKSIIALIKRQHATIYRI